MEDQEADGVIARYDDGSCVVLDGYSGGAAAEGAWGAVFLREIRPDGTSEVWEYRRVARRPGLDEDRQD